MHIRIGTLSKALGTGGGFVCGRQSLIDWLANRARTYVFSTAQPAATSAAAMAALDIVRDEPNRRARTCWRRRRNSACGFASRLEYRQSESQIIPLYVGEPEQSGAVWPARLREAGFFVPAIRPPSVPEGESLLRLSLCYHHTREMVDGLVSQLTNA